MGQNPLQMDALDLLSSFASQVDGDNDKLSRKSNPLANALIVYQYFSTQYSLSNAPRNVVHTWCKPTRLGMRSCRNSRSGVRISQRDQINHSADRAFVLFRARPRSQRTIIPVTVASISWSAEALEVPLYRIIPVSAYDAKACGKWVVNHGNLLPTACPLRTLHSIGLRFDISYGS
jgi:hypothetical protein